MLWAGIASAQTDVTTIPKKLKIGQVLQAPAVGDWMLTIGTDGMVKKDTIPTGGGATATGVNGLVGSTNIGLGGTLIQNTTETLGGFSLFLNQTFPLDIIGFKSSGTAVARINGSGEFLGGGAGNYADVRNSNIRTTSTGTIITRDIADSHNNLTVASTNYLANGLIANLQNYYRSSWLISTQGDLQHFPTVAAFGGHGYGHYMAGHVKATANGDLLIGMTLEPVFGSSIIASTNTLTPGTGYPNGVQYATFTGGTGIDAVAQVTVSGGAIASYLMVDQGLNYTVGDVLTFIMEDATGTPVGSGGTITVNSITSFTGVRKVSARFTNAPILLDNVTAPTNFLNGMMWQDGTHLNARLNGASYQLDQQVISNSFSATGSATTTFTVTIGITQANNTYRVNVTPTSVVAAAPFYVTNKTTTTFQVVYPSAVTGLVKFDYSVMK